MSSTIWWPRARNALQSCGSRVSSSLAAAVVLMFCVAPYTTNVASPAGYVQTQITCIMTGTVTHSINLLCFYSHGHYCGRKHSPSLPPDCRKGEPASRPGIAPSRGSRALPAAAEPAATRQHVDCPAGLPVAGESRLPGGAPAVGVLRAHAVLDPDPGAAIRRDQNKTDRDRDQRDPGRDYGVREQSCQHPAGCGKCQSGVVSQRPIESDSAPCHPSAPIAQHALRVSAGMGTAAPPDCTSFAGHGMQFLAARCDHNLRSPGGAQPQPACRSAPG